MSEELAADLPRAALLAEFERRIATRKLFVEYGQVCDITKPLGIENRGAYPWQVDFHNAGADHQERLLMAGNRVGKSSCGAAEAACHLTGRYPSWWKGKRFERAVRAWAGSESWEASRDIIQASLIGSEGRKGTGWIPEKYLLDVRRRQAGVAEVADMLLVRHKSGGVSTLSFKTYEQERQKWQGSKLDFVWLDEEPPENLFFEALTRILDSKGILYLTFTPLLGHSKVVEHFLKPQTTGIYVKTISWDDAPHLGKADKERMWASYPAYQRDARTKGAPMLGTGAVFPIGDEEISINPFEIPAHFYRINGIDFGIDHPAAGVFLAWDKDSDTIYLYDCYKRSGETPIYHAAAIKKHGDWIPVAWPVDGMQRDKGSGTALKDLYREHGAYMMREAAHYPDERGRAVEPGVIELYEYMRTNKFKVFKTLSEWFDEKRTYHREDGQIIKERDDLMAATRYAFMMRRYAVVRLPKFARQPQKPRGPIVGGRLRHHE